MSEPTRILELWFDGLLTTEERDRRLDDLQIRGANDAQRYTGYDYAQQRWIEWPFQGPGRLHRKVQ